jgi:hypothetical protein
MGAVAERRRRRVIHMLLLRRWRRPTVMTAEVIPVHHLCVLLRRV